MCGKGIHRVDKGYWDGINKVWVDHKHCYMDYFCDIGFCDCKHEGSPDGACNCPLDEDDDESTSDG